jgi:hypothetical protein
MGQKSEGKGTEKGMEKREGVKGGIWREKREGKGT